MIAIHAAGHTVCARAGRVWLHRQGDGDGDLQPADARKLAAALEEAADLADRQRKAAGWTQRVTDGEAARRARRALQLAVEYTMDDREEDR